MDVGERYVCHRHEYDDHGREYDGLGQEYDALTEHGGRDIERGQFALESALERVSARGVKDRIIGRVREVN